MNINVVRGFNYLRKRRGQAGGAWEKHGGHKTREL